MGFNVHQCQLAPEPRSGDSGTWGGYRGLSNSEVTLSRKHTDEGEGTSGFNVERLTLNEVGFLEKEVKSYEINARVSRVIHLSSCPKQVPEKERDY
jgi:hypothetical protein